MTKSEQLYQDWQKRKISDFQLITELMKICKEYEENLWSQNMEKLQRDLNESYNKFISGGNKE